jgi:hypothetical protein
VKIGLFGLQQSPTGVRCINFFIYRWRIVMKVVNLIHGFTI